MFLLIFYDNLKFLSHHINILFNNLLTWTHILFQSLKSQDVLLKRFTKLWEYHFHLFILLCLHFNSLKIYYTLTLFISSSIYKESRSAFSPESRSNYFTCYCSTLFDASIWSFSEFKSETISVAIAEVRFFKSISVDNLVYTSIRIISVIFSVIFA